MGASGCPPNGTRIVHYVTDVLLIQQNTIPDGKTASPVQERSKNSLFLYRFPAHLVDMFRAVELFIKVNSKITCDVDPLDWLSEELYCSGFCIRLPVLAKSIAELLETLMAILHSLNHCSRSLSKVSRYLTRSAGRRDVAMMAVSSA
jgi:hypothetical protein